MKTKSMWLLVTLAAVVAVSASSASGGIVASFPGPKDFNGTSDMEYLDDVSIGLEGSVCLEFKADLTDYPSVYGALWYLADPPRWLSQ